MSALYIINANSTGLPSISNIGQFFYILLLVVFVAFLAFYSTRLLVSARNGVRPGAKRNINVIESMGIGMNAIVQIVRVGDKYLLLGITKERVTMLAELDESKIEIPEINMPFNNVIEKFMKREVKNNEAKNDEV